MPLLKRKFEVDLSRSELLMPVVMRLGAFWRVIFMAGMAWKEDEDSRVPSCPFKDDSVNSLEIARNRILNPAILKIARNRILNPAILEIPQNRFDDTHTRKVFYSIFPQKKHIEQIPAQTGMCPAQMYFFLKPDSVAYEYHGNGSWKLLSSIVLPPK